MSQRDPTDELLTAMASVGLHPKQIHWDNRFRRFPGIDRKKGDAGWLKAFVDQRGAIFGDNRTKQQWNWPSDDPEWRKSMKGLEPLSAEEVRTKQAKAVAERVKDAKKATELVRKFWESAKKPPTNHPYLEKKGITDVPVLRSTVDSKTNQPILLIPMRNVDGELICLQRIWPDGTRRQMWQPGGCRGLYDTIGAKHYRETKTLHVCEGWTTGWSIHLATKSAVIVAFFDGGLKTVGKIIKKKYPEARIVICADNDRWKPVPRDGKDVNPGVYAARAAAKELGADLAIPEFENLDKEPTDFDDLRQREGIDAVRKWLDPKMAGQAVTEAWKVEPEPAPEEEPEPEPKPKPKPKPKKPKKPKATAEPDPDPGEYVPRRDLRNQQERFQCDPTALGHRILDRMAGKVLIVEQEDESTTALMLRESGRWTSSPEPWRAAMVEELQHMLTDIATELVEKSVTLTEAKSRSNRIHSVLQHIDRKIAAVRAAIATAWHLFMKPYDATFDRPRIVRHDQLDADLDCMGFENGVVHLPSAKLLDPASGADRYITKSTGRPFNPLKADQADTLFGHLENDLLAFWRDVLAWAIRGQPSRRIWLVVGKRNSGKTTVATALQAALGDYAGSIMQDALQKQRGDAAHKGIAVFGAPRRIIVVEEPATGTLDTALLKLLSGGGRVTVRRLYKDPFTVDATASLIIFANPGASVPRLGLADPALAERVREVPYPSVPHADRDPAFLSNTILSDDFREALAARLVLDGAKLSGPPSAPVAVQEATQRRLELDMTPFEDFSRHLKQGGPDDFLPSATVWAEWCRFRGVDNPELDQKVGGFTKRTLNMKLKKTVAGLPKASTERIAGKVTRGWKCWTYDA